MRTILISVIRHLLVGVLFWLVTGVVLGFFSAGPTLIPIAGLAVLSFLERDR